MKIYIAGRYARRDEFREVAKKLEEKLHFTITSRWLTETEPLDSNMGDHSDEFYSVTAQIDLQDVDEADAIIFFSEDPLQGWVRGGRHVEFGYALAKNKPIFVIGPKENVFHYNGRVVNFFSLDGFIESQLSAYQYLLNNIRANNPDITEERIKLVKRQLGIEWFQEGVELQEKGGIDTTDILGG